jgi:hypothetical protein
VVRVGLWVLLFAALLGRGWKLEASEVLLPVSEKLNRSDLVIVGTLTDVKNGFECSRENCIRVREGPAP